VNILGVNAFSSDSSAALFAEGELVAAVAQERFDRIKRSAQFPADAIRFCLTHANMGLKDIDVIAYSFRPWEALTGRLPLFLRYFPGSLNWFSSHGAVASNMLCFKKVFQRSMKYSLNKHQKIFFADHHLAHAYSAFFPSSFEKALIVIMDASSERGATSIFLGHGNRITPLRKILFPHSLGYLYGAMTQFLGFKIMCDEGKVMGLAPYGRDVYGQEFSRLVRIDDSGGYRLALKYFTHHVGGRIDRQTGEKMFADPRMAALFGPARQPKEPIEDRHKNIAFGVQKRLEECTQALLGHVRHREKSVRGLPICLAGGVALNCVNNYHIAKLAAGSKMYVAMAPGDDGSAIGAAIAAHRQAYPTYRSAPTEHAYWGPSVDSVPAAAFLRTKNVRFSQVKNKEKAAAALLKEHYVIGWMQGRMEMGPRALGNRSILANPCSPHIKDRLNQEVKFRESFRPYAPAVLEEYMSEFFEPVGPSPFMSFACPVRKKIIPGVTHVDGTARLQTVNEQQNPTFYKLIKCFFEMTGIPLVLNTSFNRLGEPIVHTIDDALDVFSKTGMDALFIGACLIYKDRVPETLTREG